MLLILSVKHRKKWKKITRRKKSSGHGTATRFLLPHTTVRDVKQNDNEWKSLIRENTEGKELASNNLERIIFPAFSMNGRLKHACIQADWIGLNSEILEWMSLKSLSKPLKRN